MNVPSLILAVLGVSAMAGLITAYYKRSEGKETIDLLKSNNDALKESLKIKRDRITYLQGVVDEKDRLISRLSRDKS